MSGMDAHSQRYRVIQEGVIALERTPTFTYTAQDKALTSS